MPILLAVLGLLAGGYFWMNRARDAAGMVDEIADAAQNLLGAKRRFGFRRQANRHAVDCIDQPDLAACALAVAFLELGGMPTDEQKKTLLVGLQSGLGVPMNDADEMMVLGHWLVQECNGAQPAIERLAKRLNKLSGADGLAGTATAIQHYIKNSPGEISDRQSDALDDMKRIFRPR
ncbi:MAG: hypothetical protein KUG69_02240 [Marinosulfonomonas sp.]|nr:hypothetical protein [Marinosulfonomonas sp.]